MELTKYGKIVDRYINPIPEQYTATVDQYVIMPNHIHHIPVIRNYDELRAIRESPLRVRSILSKTIGYIKMNASKETHNRYGSMAIWQRSFHDHVIRNHRDYEKISKYICENPIKWQYDCFYTED
ncbi:MAG: transposase [Clostridia bacterium]|nr:transposase [Clostridia bacterium]